MFGEQRKPGRGTFIVFEGLDRSGKTTQCDILTRTLVANGIAIKNMSFPNRSSSTGKQLDAYLKSGVEVDQKRIHQLFSENRWECHETIISALKSGMHVICDRYAFSGVAYSVANGLDYDWCRNADTGLVAPDVVFYLDIFPQQCAERGMFGGERYERIEFQNRVWQHYQRFLTERHNWVAINATQSKEDIQCEIEKICFEKFEEYCERPLEFLWYQYNPDGGLDPLPLLLTDDLLDRPPILE